MLNILQVCVHCVSNLPIAILLKKKSGKLDPRFMQFPLQHSSLLINIWYDCTGPYLFDVSASSTEPIAAAGAGEGVMM